jgi:phosphotransferase system enzyme I (PtsI)
MQVQTSTSKSDSLPALSLSRGLGSGIVVFLHDSDRGVIKHHLDADDREKEITRFDSAFEKCRTELVSLSAETSSKDSNAIFGVHLVILDSSVIKQKVEEHIREHGINSEWALQRVSELYHDDFAEIEDERFREKLKEFDDVIARIQRKLSTVRKIDYSRFKGKIAAARELRTSQLYELLHHSPSAVIVEHGGWTSHISIIAREFGVPMITGIGDPFEVLTEGDFLVVNGDIGVVSTGRPSVDSTNALGSENSDAADVTHALMTKDGVAIKILGNADSVASAKRAIDRNALGIGLFRTDGLIGDDGEVPNEAAQTAVYSKLFQSVNEYPIAIRTFDFGVESFRHQRSGINPALGLRSLRLCLSHPELFRDQIRALLRSGNGSLVKLVFPMVSGLSDLRQAKDFVSSVAAELGKAGVEVSIPPIGVMIELPSAVLMINEIAAEADFLCIGTNDLVQYLLGADRDNEQVARWYQSLHPAVLGSLAAIIKAGNELGKDVTVCGEMASSPFYIPILLGLRFRELSMNSGSFNRARRLISNISISECESLAQGALQLDTSEAVEAMLLETYTSDWSHLMPAGVLNS